MAGEPQQTELPYSLIAVDDLKDSQVDVVLLVAPSVDNLPDSLSCLRDCVVEYAKEKMPKTSGPIMDHLWSNRGAAFHDAECAMLNVLDKSCNKEPCLIPCPNVAGGRMIYSPTGPVSRDYDDVRRFEEAGRRGMEKVLAAGCRAPLLVVQGAPMKFVLGVRVANLGALHVLYTPIEVREARPQRAAKVDRVGIWCDPEDPISKGTIMFFTNVVLMTLQRARQVCCDIGGSDPERMSPIRVTEYVTETLKDTCIKVDVISDLSVMEREYPLLVAVNRANRGIARQAPRVIFLEYEDKSNPVDLTVLMVGKGVTYDTGGADLKVNGSMAGMHRDKCGAAFVAGFFKLLSLWKPEGIKVIGAMPLVRNSVGADAYVSDEIITSRAGVRVRVGNTDAEGRMIMADVLCQMKEKALLEVNPNLYTFATLTGHVIRCYGDNYTAVVGNGPAMKLGVVDKILKTGDIAGDPAEQSTLRREDYSAHMGKSEYEDVVQSNGKPSVQTNRGHQTPAAFLIMASGLDKHGNDSAKPLPYCHLDIAGVAGDMPAPPTGRPLLAFAHMYTLNRCSPSTAIPEDKEHMIGYKDD